MTGRHLIYGPSTTLVPARSLNVMHAMIAGLGCRDLSMPLFDGLKGFPVPQAGRP